MALKEQARFLSHYLACKPKKFALALLPVYPITVSVDTHTLFYLLAQIYVTLSLSLSLLTTTILLVIKVTTCTWAHLHLKVSQRLVLC